MPFSIFYAKKIDNYNDSASECDEENRYEESVFDTYHQAELSAEAMLEDHAMNPYSTGNLRYEIEEIS